MRTERRTRSAGRAAIVALAWLAFAPGVEGQDDDDIVAYIALVSTPTGGLVPLPTGAQLAPPQSAWSFRYGYISFGGDDALHSIGLTGQFQAAGGLAGVTGGVRVCGGCDPTILLGLDWTVALSRTAFTDAALVIALAPAIGVGILTSENANGGFLSGALAVPFTLVAGTGGGVRVSPYLTPAIGIGTATADVQVGGARPMLGGGLAILTDGGLQASVGFQKVFIDGGDSVIGLAMSFGRR